MSRLNIAPTKSSQLVLKRSLRMASEGFTLLEQKREILVMELMRLLDRVKQVQAELAVRRQKAYSTLRQALAHNGYHHLRNIADGIHYDHLETAGKLAELETSVWLLARELKKTQRRVNALEQIFIPNYKDTLRYIAEALESKELDSFFTMKMVKKRLTKAKEEPPAEPAGDQPAPRP